MATLTLQDADVLSAEAGRALRRVAGTAWSKDTYLAGSAALALYVGHRSVGNIDLMTASNRLGGPERRDLLQDLKAMDPDLEVETARDGYLYAALAEGVGLRVFYYPYPLIDTEETFHGLAVASPVDLGLMKLAAIIGRGTRRDFVDLYLLCQEIDLRELLSRSHEKFGHVRDFPVQALKALVDFSLIEGEPMPKLSRGLDWDTVRAWLETATRDVAAERFGL